MISSTTPYKLSEIIRDTWPGLYNSPKKTYSEKASSTSNESDTKTSTD
jgi:hypothetical protein